MNKEQFDILCKKLDRLAALLTIQLIQDKDDKIYTLKKMGLSSEEIGLLVGIKNPRQTKGWKRA